MDIFFVSVLEKRKNAYLSHKKEKGSKHREGKRVRETEKKQEKYIWAKQHGRKYKWWKEG